MKELSNSYKDKKPFWRKATAIVGVLVALTACEQSQIIEGTVYQKEHTKTDYGYTYKARYWREEIDREVYSLPSIHEEKGTDKEKISRFPQSHVESWKVYIAQCPKGELLPQDRIEKECKTNSFDVPQDVYNILQIGKQADFKQPK